MADSEPFTLVEPSSFVEPSSGHRLFDDYRELTSGRTVDLDIQISASLKKQFPEMIVTTVPAYNCNLLAFAAAGYATAERDTKTDSVASWRFYVSPGRRGGNGGVYESVFFAKYHYRWSGEDFILYTVLVGYYVLQYILKEPQNGETPTTSSVITDALLVAIGTLSDKTSEGSILVYDGYWRYSRELWEHVQKASWDKVILDPDMKRELTEVSEKFFDSKDVYDELGVPWKRGLIFYGPAGNGKTISITALMRTLYNRDRPIPALYVKTAPSTYDIRSIFRMARAMSPCLLVLEDIDTIVTEHSRSYFFNEVDGLEKNDGILMVASTNHLDRLDPGLSKRPSRFDRKYLFDLPNKDERELYCEFWRKKLADNAVVDFPKKLCPPIASITKGFSFAYMQEAFVASLLEIARHESSCSKQPLAGGEEEGGGGDKDDLDHYQLWRVIKKQVKILRDEMDYRCLRMPKTCRMRWKLN